MKIKGLEKLKLNLKNIERISSKEISRAGFLSAQDVKRTAIRKINEGSRSGETYKRGGVQHKASAPGEPPKTDLGILVSNIIDEFRDGKWFVGSSKNAPHGLYLELGTQDIKARPWLRPSLQENQAGIVKRFTQAIRKSI